MKYSEHHYVSDTNDLILYLSMVFFTAMVLGFIIIGVKIANRNFKPALRNVWAGLILGLINFGSTFYILKAMSIYDSSVIFPITNAGIVSLSAMIGFLFFREKLSTRNWIGICLAILAILLIAYA